MAGEAPGRLGVGDFAPPFEVAFSRNPVLRSSSMGAALVLCFLGRRDQRHGRDVLRELVPMREALVQRRTLVIAVSGDAADRDAPELAALREAFGFAWDLDGAMAASYGALIGAPTMAGLGSAVVDDNRRIAAIEQFTDDAAAHAERLGRCVAAIARAEPPPRDVRRQAPVLVVPRALDPADCARLIAAYEVLGGSESGFMLARGEGTVGVFDDRFKRRRDVMIKDPELRAMIGQRLHARIVPEIERVFCSSVQFIERFLVACYDASERGHFGPHRDNGSPATAHRKFAVTMALNDDYEGGGLRFPEYSQDTYRLAAGDAVVFSCSLTHAALPVTKGRRYALLPFLFDREGERIWQANKDKPVHLDSAPLAPGRQS